MPSLYVWDDEERGETMLEFIAPTFRVGLSLGNTKLDPEATWYMIGRDEDGQLTIGECGTIREAREHN